MAIESWSRFPVERDSPSPNFHYIHSKIAFFPVAYSHILFDQTLTVISGNLCSLKLYRIYASLVLYISIVVKRANLHGRRWSSRASRIEDGKLFRKRDSRKRRGSEAGGKNEPKERGRLQKMDHRAILSPLVKATARQQPEVSHELVALFLYCSLVLYFFRLSLHVERVKRAFIV